MLSPRTLIRGYVHTASRPDRKHAMGDELGRAPIAFSFSFSFLFSFSFSVFVFVSALSLSLFPFPFLFLFYFSSLFYGSTVYGSLPCCALINKLWRASPSHERKLNIWARWV